MKAEKVWFRIIQKERFPQEVERMSSGRELPKTSQIAQLDPFFSEDRLLRVGGRIEKSELSYEARHPIILPHRHVVVEMLVRRCHEGQMHAGVEHTLAVLRQRFWILRARSVVKGIVRGCVTCRKVSSAPFAQKMAPLPEERITEAFPFQRTGIDFAGPLYVECGNCCKKAYICLFTCMTIRAVHLELVMDMSVDQFLLALRRFVARRGKPSLIQSDNFTTFKAADKEVQQLFKGRNLNKVKEKLSSEGIEWKFITERAPWTGGYWERLIRSVKTPLKKVLGRALLNEPELRTVLTEIEAKINSRPLTFVGDDPRDASVLTPFHFLIGREFLEFPEQGSARERSAVGYQGGTELRRRWRHQQRLVSHFWKRWRAEYVTTLSVRKKWCGQKPSPMVGDIVLIAEEHVPRARWLMGRVLEVLPGSDGLFSLFNQRSAIRVETLKRMESVLTRMRLDNGALPICWSLLCIACFSCTQIYRGRGSVPISASTVDSWARSFGSELYAAASQATQAEGLERKYREHNVRVEMFDPEEVIEVMKSRLEAFLGRRRQLAEILKESLESSYKIFHEVDRSVINDLNSEDFYRFVNAKSCLNRHHIDPLLVNSSLEVQYIPNPNFLNLPVNIEKSAVHVPTPVYSREPELLSEIIWTESLDHIFKARRAREFFAASWQYFCSQRGFMRFYPASPWFYDDEQTCLDMYDCRNSEWYIDAATHAKNIVILLDVSGSMLGQRYEIAKQTIEMIMETLTENDFFNILVFSDEPRFVLPCFRNRLVQATIRNKKLLRAKLDNITSEGIANLPAALKMAFEVVIDARETQKNAGCHSAIMLITDGATDTYEDIFNRYNEDKSIRFFSYLIGDDVTEFREVRWMACYNRGYFAHISNLADVQEKVQSYITIMSRPVAERNHTEPVWTGAYFDQLGHILVATVAFPVIANESFRGVVGASALITELQQMAPSYMLGANAYSFIVDNNGYVVHHPQLRSLHMGKPKPHYNSMDIMELEVLADNALDNSTVETPVDYDNQLRRYLADGISSKELDAKMSQKVIMAMDGPDSLRRVYTQKNVYYHRGIKNTLMTLALAVPEQAVYRIEIPNEGHSQANLNINFDWFKGRNWKLHPDWHYCRLNDSNTGVTKEEAFVVYMRQYTSTGKIPRNCALYEYLIRRVLFDMEVTSDMESLWTQQGQIDQSKGIHIVFLATHSGLTRFVTTGLDDIRYQPEVDESLEEGNATDAEDATVSNKYLYVPFATRYPRALDEVFYKRALQFVNGEFVFDVKTDQYLYIRNGSQMYPLAKDRKTFVVTAARAVFARDDRGHTAPASVVGIEMLYAAFEEMMYNASQRLCRPHSPVRCYLLDEHGYVIYASKPARADHRSFYLGKFFGSLSLEPPSTEPRNGF
uniref:Integrase catalytic domain-containing protein n=1 Tax=Trichuris muris TaxID=70415 RepID=A0A5S6QYI8_TRIMR